MPRTLNYTADGLSMASELFVSEGTGPRPAVLVFPEIFGISHHARSRAEQLAGLGYAALVCDIHGGGALMSDLQEVLALMGPVRGDVARVRARDA